MSPPASTAPDDAQPASAQELEDGASPDNAWPNVMDGQPSLMDSAARLIDIGARFAARERGTEPA